MRHPLADLMHAIASADHARAMAMLGGSPAVAVAQLPRMDEQFIVDCGMQVYQGDTALHIAAAAYDVEIARELVGRGADVRARNRRGAEPLHAAVRGGPGSTNWDPARQRSVIEYLIEAGADVNSPASGGVTALHRAVRNRCSAAVIALLAAGCDASLTNDSGSTAMDLAHLTTGRGGTGSDAAKAEQRLIVEALGWVSP